MKIRCKETINSDFDTTIFTQNKRYEFIPVNNRYTNVTMKDYNFIGYVQKDDEGYKRWLSKDFKDQYFENV